MNAELSHYKKILLSCLQDWLKFLRFIIGQTSLYNDKIT